MEARRLLRSASCFHQNGMMTFPEKLPLDHISQMVDCVQCWNLKIRVPIFFCECHALLNILLNTKFLPKNDVGNLEGPLLDTPRRLSVFPVDGLVGIVCTGSAERRRGALRTFPTNPHLPANPWRCCGVGIPASRPEQGLLLQSLRRAS